MDKAELDALVPVAEVPPRREKVAVLGFTNSCQLAPFNDPEWEIWGLNELYMFIPRWDRWFELHKREIYEADKKRVSDHVERLKAMTCPVYMHQRWDDIPGSTAYPLEQVVGKFGNYFTNSISYMMALAIMEGFREIGVYGVDMAHDCLTPEMRVLTTNLQWIRAGDLQIGQELLAFDEEPIHAGSGKHAEFRKYRKTTVESLSRIVRPCRAIIMADGTKLIASVGHKWLTLGGLKNIRRWLETAKLQPQDIFPTHASRIVKVLNVWDELKSWDAGYLAAAFDGEGHISHGPRPNCQSSHFSVGFSQRLNGMSEEVERCLVVAGFDFNWNKGHEGTMKYGVKGGRQELLRFLGSIRPRRLMQKFDADQVGTLNSIEDTQVVKNEAVGEREVVGIRTGTGTLIVEGFASHNSEYGSQRPSCEYIIGWAMGMGIKVTIPYQSDLLKTNFLYGYQEEEERAFHEKLTARERELNQKMGQLDQQIAELTEARSQYRGAVQDCQHIRKIWSPSANLTMGKPPGG